MSEKLLSVVKTREMPLVESLKTDREMFQAGNKQSANGRVLCEGLDSPLNTPCVVMNRGAQRAVPLPWELGLH